MTEREEFILAALLDALAGCVAPAAEPLLQYKIQNRLGVTISVAELRLALDFADLRRFVTGLPGANEKMQWSLTDHGRHFRANARQ